MLSRSPYCSVRRWSTSASPARRRSRQIPKAGAANTNSSIFARARGFQEVEIIDDDLDRSGSGTVARPGYGIAPAV
jgi:hypothetical protein